MPVLRWNARATHGTTFGSTSVHLESTSTDFRFVQEATQEGLRGSCGCGILCLSGRIFAKFLKGPMSCNAVTLDSCNEKTYLHSADEKAMAVHQEIWPVVRGASSYRRFYCPCFVT